jgi:hypothetical protein
MRKPAMKGYPAEFKERAVKLAVESEQPIAQTARDLVLIRYHFDYELAQIWRSEVLEMSRHGPSGRRPCQGCGDTTWTG